MISRKRSRNDLHAFLAACGLRFEGVQVPPIEPIGYVRPTTRPLTEAEQAVLAQVDAELLAQRPPWPEPTPSERWATLVEAERVEGRG